MKKTCATAGRWLLILLVAAFFLTACTAEEGFSRDGAPEVTNPDYERTPPPVQLAEYVGENQVANDDGTTSGLIDMTNAAKGYVAAQCTSSKETRIRVTKDGESDDYLLDNNGTFNFYPLARGSGTYTVILYVFAGDTPQGPSYVRFIETSVTASIEDEFAPFLVPNKIVDYNENSACVQLSYELAQHCATNLEVVQQIYYYIAKNISYDYDKAERLQGPSPEAYEPSPDETLRQKSGICYDYASLAAAMLRANGIPTKLIKGDVLNGEGMPVYHAWNMIWLKESGWIAIKLPTKPGDWTRIDLTFAASAAAPGGRDISSFVGDGENYTDLSVH